MQVKNNKSLMLTMFILLTAASVTVFAATGDPFAAFKGSFLAQAQNYVLPIIIMVTIIAAAITYMRTKDWTTSLVVGAVAAGIIGGAITLGAKFADFNLSTT